MSGDLKWTNFSLHSLSKEECSKLSRGAQTTCRKIEEATNSTILVVIQLIIDACLWDCCSNVRLAILAEELLRMVVDEEKQLGDIGLKNWCILLQAERTNWVRVVNLLSNAVDRTGAASVTYLHPDDVRAAAEEAIRQRRSRQKRPGASGAAAGSGDQRTCDTVTD